MGLAGDGADTEGAGDGRPLAPVPLGLWTAAGTCSRRGLPSRLGPLRPGAGVRHGRVLETGTQGRWVGVWRALGWEGGCGQPPAPLPTVGYPPGWGPYLGSCGCGAPGSCGCGAPGSCGCGCAPDQVGAVRPRSARATTVPGIFMGPIALHHHARFLHGARTPRAIAPGGCMGPDRPGPLRQVRAWGQSALHHRARRGMGARAPGADRCSSPRPSSATRAWAGSSGRGRGRRRRGRG
jgi:hypothetical protein